jgi:hypothetical protein
MTIPECQGDARYDNERQAHYVAAQLEREFGTVWNVIPHGVHFHLRDSGEAPKEPDHPEPTQGTDHA